MYISAGTADWGPSQPAITNDATPPPAAGQLHVNSTDDECYD